MVQFCINFHLELVLYQTKTLFQNFLKELSFYGKGTDPKFVISVPFPRKDDQNQEILAVVQKTLAIKLSKYVKIKVLSSL